MFTKMKRRIAAAVLHGFLINLLFPVAKSEMPDSMNAILIKCPENNSNKSCETQLIVNIHMSPSFDLENTEKFWVVDKVFDPSKGSTSKIISPYLIVVSRGEPVVMYPLRFIKSINNEKISKKPSKEVNNNAELGSSPSCTTNEGQLETNIKGQAMGNATRLKRNHFPLYATGKSFISNIFGTKRHKKNVPSRRRDKGINDLQQKDLSSLGLVQVLDTDVTKNYLDSPYNILNSYKDTQSKELDNDNLVKWHDHYIPKSKSEDFSIKSQMNTQHKENLKSLNIADDADKLFSYANSQNRKQQNNGGKLYTKYEKSEEESVPEYLLYNRLAQESRRNKIKENLDKNYVPPRKSMYNSNEFSNREDHESIEYKLPPKSLNDVQGFPYESVDNQFPNQERVPHKMENENYNLITSGDRKTNTYEFPIKRENNNLRSHSIGDAYDFPHESKKHYENYKQLLEGNYVPQERKYKKKNFKGYNSQYNKYDFPLEAEKDLYYSRTPIERLSSDMDFPSKKENKENNLKNPTYSYSDPNGFSHGNPYDNSLSNEKDFESSNENLNLNAPKSNLYNHNFNFNTKLEYPSLPENNANDFSWTHSNIKDESLDSIVNRHMNQKLSDSFNAPNDLNLDYFNPASSQKYLDFVSKQNTNPYLTYSKTNSYKTFPYPRSPNLKRMKRDGLQDRHMENGEDSRLDPKYDADLDSLKALNLKRIDDNGEIPCDTCGGKNKKKDEKPRTIYSSALAESKSLDGKIENADPKIDDAVPCDTCGGKNKKPGGKPLPGGLPPEVNSLDAESDERRLPDYMIPCESCKKSNRYTEGNLESASCGCVTNQKVCNCESSKLSRALNDSLKEWSYTVFNMNNPVPFLSTKLRVFRRRHNTWWLVVPIVTLDSVSGIFANDNFSAVLTSHIDMIRLEKSTGFSNRNLAVPKEIENAFARKRHAITLKDLQDNIGNSVLLDESNKDVSIREIKNSCNLKVENKESMKGLASRSIKGLGYFPVSMNALDNCPHKDKTLCLNIREDKVPGEFSLKVKIPFRENALVMRNQHMVKISRIITDATTKDALQISIDVINKGFEAQEYTIFVCNCDILKSESTSNTARRLLQPDIGQTVIFLLPLIIGSKKNKKYSCDVMVKASTDYDESDTNLPKPVDPKVGVVAKRTMEIKCHSRCFCVWRCRCHCIGKLETFINYNACERMDPKSEKEAGLVYNCPPGNEPNDVCIKDVCSDRSEEITCKLTCKVIAITLLVLMLLFLLGLLKAILGICITCIGRCGFDTVQPGRTYECTSCIRIFLVNCLFFIIYPFVCWCKCFRPKPKDLIEASSDWDCIPQSDETPECSCDKNESSCRLHGGQDLQNNLVLAFAPLHENGLFKDEKSDDEESHLFILEVLEESKSSLTKMMSQVLDPVQNVEQSNVEQSTESNADVMAAEEFVECLRNSQVAYRTLSSPVGGVVDIPDNYQYCVKGFFVQTISSNFEFMSYHPLSQFVGITEENEVRPLAQPRYIHSNQFSRIYADKMEVHKAADLSVVPPMDVPCINIDHGNHLEGSFVKLAAQQEKMKANQT